MNKQWSCELFHDNNLLHVTRVDKNAASVFTCLTALCSRSMFKSSAFFGQLGLAHSPLGIRYMSSPLHVHTCGIRVTVVHNWLVKVGFHRWPGFPLVITMTCPDMIWLDWIDALESSGSSKDMSILLRTASPHFRGKLDQSMVDCDRKLNKERHFPNQD